MNFSFHPDAEKEFNEAIDYYEDMEPGLGMVFCIRKKKTESSLSQ